MPPTGTVINKNHGKAINELLDSFKFLGMPRQTYPRKEMIAGENASKQTVVTKITCVIYQISELTF